MNKDVPLYSGFDDDKIWLILADENCFFSVPPDWYDARKETFMRSVDDYDPNSILTHIASGYKITLSTLMYKLNKFEQNHHNDAEKNFTRSIYFIYIDDVVDNVVRAEKISSSGLSPLYALYASNITNCLSFIRSRKDVASWQDLSSDPHDHEFKPWPFPKPDDSPLPILKPSSSISCQPVCSEVAMGNRLLSKTEFELVTGLPYKPFYKQYVHDFARNIKN